jgi:hypothetical protein
MRAVLALVVLLAAATPARAADPPPPAPAPEAPRHVASLPLLAVSGGTLALQGERYLGPERRWSVALALGLRAAAGGDYGSLALSLGGEGRWWFHRPARGTGGFAGARLDVARTAVSDDTHDVALPTTWSWATSLLVGYRWVLWRHLELTPELGLVRTVEVPEGRLVAQSRGSLSIGLTIGWMF